MIETHLIHGRYSKEKPSSKNKIIQQLSSKIYWEAYQRSTLPPLMIFKGKLLIKDINALLDLHGSVQSLHKL